MAAYDNVSLPGPPDIAHAGNYADMLMRGLQAIPDKYYKAKDFQYQQQQRDLFQSPDSQAMLQDALKSGNYAPVMQKIIQAQGASAGPVIGQLISDQAGARLAESINGGGGSQPGAVNTSTISQNADGLAKASQRLEGGGPRTPYSNPSTLSATDNPGGETIRTLTAGLANGRPVQEPTMANYGRALGVDPDTPLSADQEARARKIIGNNLAPGTSPGGMPAQSPPPATNDAASGGSPINSAAAPQGNESPSVGAGGGQAISPAPTAAAGGIQPSGPRVAEAPRDTLTAADRGIRPTPVGTEAQAQQAETRAKNMRALQAYYAGRNPKAAEAIGARAAEEEKRAHEIRDSIGKYNEPTPTQKDVETGADLRAAQNKEDTTRYGKQMAAIQGSSQAANRQLEHIQLAEGIYSNPNFYSGAGEGLNLAYKRVVNALNPNSTESLPQEAFRKTMAASVLNQVEQLKDDTAAVGGGGRIFQAQIELMEKAANNPDNSINANRLLTEVAKRAALAAKTIAQMANSYKGGHLDAGFAQKLDDYYTEHPMFKPEEIADIRRIAPPLARTPADLKKIGWKDGEPFRTPDGRIFTHAPAQP